MSESMFTNASLAPVSTRSPAHAGASDLRMLAQVEKWMATIRELNREQQSQPAFQR